MARTDRLLQLLHMLRGYRLPVRGAVLAGRLEVSLRTVYRDIETLRAQGAPIDGEAGLGFVLRPGFLMPPLMFSQAELEALVLGARWVARQADPALAEAARGALARISAVLPAGLRDQVEDSPLLLGPPAVGAEPVAGMAALLAAIRDERRVSFAYTDADGQGSRRTVWPLAVSFFERVRVLVAWCELRQDYRSFRLDRLSELEPGAERYPRPRHQMLAEWHERTGIPRQDLAADSP